MVFTNRLFAAILAFGVFGVLVSLWFIFPCCLKK
jgi:hypothetical protein